MGEREPVEYVKAEDGHGELQERGDGGEKEEEKEELEEVVARVSSHWSAHQFQVMA